MDTTGKGVHTGRFIQMGGNVSLRKMIHKSHPQHIGFLSALWKIYPDTYVAETLIYTKGPTHCLEITPPLPEAEPEHSQSALQLADLTSEEEEGLHGRISQYERKIDSLLTEVSSLKNEVSFSRFEVCIT